MDEDIRDAVRRAKRLQDEVRDINTRAEAEKPAERRTAPIIGISGFMGAGKDELADILGSKHGFMKTFMSEPLARSLYALNPWIPVRDDEAEGGDEWWTFYALIEAGAADVPAKGTKTLQARYRDIADAIGYTAAKKIPEVRRLLQVLGTEVGRDIIGENTWTDIAARTLTQWQADGIPAVITGIRYRNELAMIRELGGATVWIHRPGLTIPAELAMHSSETTVGPDDCDYRVDNDGTGDDWREVLAQRAEQLMREVDG